MANNEAVEMDSEPGAVQGIRVLLVVGAIAWANKV